MDAETTARIARSMEEEAARLWDEMKRVSRAEPIDSSEVIGLVGHTVGLLQGWSAALGWYQAHEGEASDPEQ